MTNKPNKEHSNQGDASVHRNCWKCHDGIVTNPDLTICRTCFVENPDEPSKGWDYPAELTLPRECRECSSGVVKNPEWTICSACLVPILDAALKLI